MLSPVCLYVYASNFLAFMCVHGCLCMSPSVCVRVHSINQYALTLRFFTFRRQGRCVWRAGNGE